MFILFGVLGFYGAGVIIWIMEIPSLVLIVDDEPVGRQTLEALLHGEALQVVFAENGAEGLAKAQDLLPDLILLDVMMPGLDGFEVCRRIRTIPMLEKTPVILVTALDERAARLAGLEAGADDFISKPFDRVELLTRVRTITRLKRQRSAIAREMRDEFGQALGALRMDLSWVQRQLESLQDGPVEIAILLEKVEGIQAALDGLMAGVQRFSTVQHPGALDHLGRTGAEASSSHPALQTILSEREYQVFLQIASGRAVGQIADDLGLSVKTISTYRTRILHKLDLKSNAELVVYAVHAQLV
jgi:DNA-binding NarL/FixJ family response regulator